MTPRLHHALLLTALLAACSTTPAEPDAVPSERATPSAAAAPTAAEDGAKSPYANVDVPVDARYLFDPETGAVLVHVPPSILADISAQLTASGQGAHIAELSRLYDLDTGHVRDEGKARAAEATMRAKLQGGAR